MGSDGANKGRIDKMSWMLEKVKGFKMIMASFSNFLFIQESNKQTITFGYLIV